MTVTQSCHAYIYQVPRPEPNTGLVLKTALRTDTRKSNCYPKSGTAPEGLAVKAEGLKTENEGKQRGNVAMALANVLSTEHLGAWTQFMHLTQEEWTGYNGKAKANWAWTPGRLPHLFTNTEQTS